jgi:hypothetical protein
MIGDWSIAQSYSALNSNTVDFTLVNYLVAATNAAGQSASIRKSNLALTASTAVVPLPAAVWLLGSSLVAFAGIARRKTNAT